MADSNGNASGNGQNFGSIESVAGVVVDVLFPDQLPEIYSALEIKVPEEGNRPALDLRGGRFRIGATARGRPEPKDGHAEARRA